MRHGSLFSGIGGFDLAAEAAGWENVFQVEKDDYCQKVLEKNFPNVKRYKDIKHFHAEPYAGIIDIVSGGFPCQPFSRAGKRKGKDDDRALWPEMLRVINTIKPRWVVGENVVGIIDLGIDDVLTSLEASGYAVETFIIPACAVNAPHRRDRVWIVANANGDEHRTDNGTNTETYQIPEVHRTQQLRAGKPSGTNCDAANTASLGLERRIVETCERKPQGELGRFDRQHSWYAAATSLCGVDDGIPERAHRIKALGNAIVPQVAFEIFKAIETV